MSTCKMGRSRGRRAWLSLSLVAVMLVTVLVTTRSSAGESKEPKAGGSGSVSLQQAYKREFAFLQSEKASLKSRLEQQRARSKKKVACPIPGCARTSSSASLPIIV